MKMPHQPRYIQVGNQQLHYLSSGNGSRLLLAFHGYGEDAGIFWQFEKYLSNNYTILSIDLPHHGKSNGPETNKLSPQQLTGMVKELMKTHHVLKISLLGYSMGGRVCLSIITEMPEVIDTVTLIATDGLSVDTYYHFFTRTTIGKKIFRNMLIHPQPYFKVISWLRKVGLSDESRYKFVMHYLGTEAARKQLGLVWPAMSELIPDTRKLKQVLDQYKIPVHLFMGKYDRVMPPKLAEKFKGGLETVHLHIVEKGHRILGTDTVEAIAQTLL